MSQEAKDLEKIVEEVAERVVLKLREIVATPGATEKAAVCIRSQSFCLFCGLCFIKEPLAMSSVVEVGAPCTSARSGATSEPASDLASMIDHTLLKADATKEDLVRLCEEARQYGFAAVCVNSGNIPLVARLLRGSGIKPVAVVGFPLGAASTQAKVIEAREAIRAGAEEIDMVINIGALKSKDYATVFYDISRVVEVARPKKVKVIIETCALSHDEKVAACVLCKAAGAAFVKTSTGFGSGGATVEDVQLIRSIVGDEMGIKASGGIRTKEVAEAMIKAGATRIGASASVAIVSGKEGRGGEKY